MKCQEAFKEHIAETSGQAVDFLTSIADEWERVRGNCETESSRFADIVSREGEDGLIARSDGEEHSGIEAAISYSEKQRGELEVLSLRVGDMAAYLQESVMPQYGGCSGDRSAERELYEKPWTEKIESILRYKEHGNNFWGNKQRCHARACWSRALLFLDYTFPEGDEQLKTYNELRIALLSNISALELVEENWNEVLNYCYQVRQIDVKHLKTGLRAAQAHMELVDWEKAEKQVSKLELDHPGNELVVKLRRRLDVREGFYHSKYKQLNKKILV